MMLQFGAEVQQIGIPRDRRLQVFAPDAGGVVRCFLLGLFSKLELQPDVTSAAMLASRIPERAAVGSEPDGIR